MYRLDLHSHSIVSHDGGISFESYKQALRHRVVDYIAVTDHNTIDGALQLQQQLGSAIIVGEEILSADGDIIGLFLKTAIVPGMSAQKTIDAIHAQDGLVYIPHPFERSRHSVSEEVLKQIIPDVDIIEIFNARGRFRNRAALVQKYAVEAFVGAVSSDAHGSYGLGSAYLSLEAAPTRDNLIRLLHTAEAVTQYAPLWTYAYPTINRIKKYYVA